MAGLLNTPPYGGGLLGSQQSGGLLGGIANFFRPWTPEDRARVAAVMPPDLAPTQIVKGMVGGAANLAMQANEAMPWGGNNPQAIGYDPQAGTIDPSVMVPFAQNVAGMVGTGGMVSPKPAGALGIFGGRMAKTADQAALAKAEQMAAQGAPRDAIWNETGWFQGADGKWRFEIQDTGSSYIGTAIKDGATTGDVLPHPDLYEAYPELGALPVRKAYGNNTHGSFDGESLGLDPSKSGFHGRSTALHEMQHAVQRAEGFATGANAASLWGHSDPKVRKAVQAEWDRLMSPISKEEFAKGYSTGWEPTAAQVDEAYTEYVTHVLKARRDTYDIANKAAQETAALNVYRRFAGETEARNVQKRMDMYGEDLRNNPPWTTQDTPDAEQIVRMSGGTSYSTGGRF